MAHTSTYFNNYGSSQEQNLFHDLVIEALGIYGLDMQYIPRRLQSLNEIYLEDDQSIYDRAYQIVAYVKDYNGYGGEGAFMSKFGLHIKSQMTFTVANRSWLSEVGDKHGWQRPREGDLIYYPLDNRLFQIMYVEDKPIHFHLHTLPTWDLTCELFEYSNEVFDTGIPEVDRIWKEHTTDIYDFGILATMNTVPELAAWTPNLVSAPLSYWYDIQPQYLFQDVAMTMPITANGQLVAAIQDRSGSGYHLLQADVAARPMYREEGTTKWLDFDGVDDRAFMSVNFASDFIHHRFAALRSMDTDTADHALWGTTQVNFRLWSDWGIAISGGVNALVINKPTANTDFVVEEKLYANTSDGFVIDTSLAVTNTSGQVHNSLTHQLLSIGSSLNGTAKSRMRFYGMASYANTLEANTQEIEQLFLYYKSLVGLAEVPTIINNESFFILTSDEKVLVTDRYNFDQIDILENNTEFEEAADQILDWSPTNPFGELICEVPEP